MTTQQDQEREAFEHADKEWRLCVEVAEMAPLTGHTVVYSWVAIAINNELTRLRAALAAQPAAAQVEAAHWMRVRRVFHEYENSAKEDTVGWLTTDFHAGPTRPTGDDWEPLYTAPPATQQPATAPAQAPKTKQEIAKQLRWLSKHMLDIATSMDYYGGMAEWAVHGLQMAGAAHIANQWADEIEKEATK